VNLMPLPTSVQPGTGSLRIDSAFSVALTGRTERRLERGVERFLQHLARQTALPISLKPSKSAQATLVIHTDHASKEIQELGEDESYVLEVTSTGAKLTAPTPLGTLHGLQTFLQLVDVSSDGFAAPAATIQDKPRFPWRGLLIDSSRHFTPLEVIRRNLDGMEAVKLNVFHWHLSDNQGFRVESRKAPKLHGLGSGGQFYTQGEIRDVIAYARDRGIRVVPEFDMPGHSTSFFAGYPEIASGPGPYALDRKWGVLDPAMNPTEERRANGTIARVFDHLKPRVVHVRDERERIAKGFAPTIADKEIAKTIGARLQAKPLAFAMDESRDLLLMIRRGGQTQHPSRQSDQLVSVHGRKARQHA